MKLSRTRKPCPGAESRLNIAAQMIGPFTHDAQTKMLIAFRTGRQADAVIVDFDLRLAARPDRAAAPET